MVFQKGHKLNHENTPEDIWKRIDKKGENDCWEWGGHTVYGYGQMRINKQRYYTHRIVWELIYAPIPEGLYVLHKCDNKICCNPSHLWLGTIEENNKDRDQKGRRVVCFGEQNGNNKLTRKQVDEIRRVYNTGNYTYFKLGELYNTHYSNIGYIMNGKTWRL